MCLYGGPLPVPVTSRVEAVEGNEIQALSAKLLNLVRGALRGCRHKRQREFASRVVDQGLNADPGTMSTLPSGSGWQPAWAIPRGKSDSYA